MPLFSTFRTCCAQAPLAGPPVAHRRPTPSESQRVSRGPALPAAARARAQLASPPANKPARYSNQQHHSSPRAGLWLKQLQSNLSPIVQSANLWPVSTTSSRRSIHGAAHKRSKLALEMSPETELPLPKERRRRLANLLAGCFDPWSVGFSFVFVFKTQIQRPSEPTERAKRKKVHTASDCKPTHKTSSSRQRRAEPMSQGKCFVKTTLSRRVRRPRCAFFRGRKCHAASGREPSKLRPPHGVSCLHFLPFPLNHRRALSFSLSVLIFVLADARQLAPPPASGRCHSLARPLAVSNGEARRDRRRSLWRRRIVCRRARPQPRRRAHQGRKTHTFGLLIEENSRSLPPPHTNNNNNCRLAATPTTCGRLPPLRVISELALRPPPLTRWPEIRLMMIGGGVLMPRVRWIGDQ